MGQLQGNTIREPKLVNLSLSQQVFPIINRFLATDYYSLVDWSPAHLLTKFVFTPLAAHPRPERGCSYPHIPNHPRMEVPERDESFVATSPQACV